MPDPTRDMPADAAAQYAVVRQGVGLIERGDVGMIEATGRDRATFLHAMLSNDITSLTPGRGCPAAFLDVHGKVQALLVVLALADRMLVLAPRDIAGKTVEDLERYHFSEKVSLEDVSESVAVTLLAGPEAPALVARLTGTTVPDAAWSHVGATLDGVDVRLVRGAGETGGPEIWLVGAASERQRMRERVRAAGTRAIESREALEALRIEAGAPRYGVDVDPSVLLPEIPLEALVSYTKGCYIGQEVVVRIRDRGHVNRHLRGLVLDGERVPAPGARLFAGDEEVGRVTSAALSFGLKRPVALAFVKRQHAEPGTSLVVETGDGRVPATVTALPIPR